MKKQKKIKGIRVRGKVERTEPLTKGFFKSKQMQLPRKPQCK
jgi:hypothetical protein